MFSTNISLLLVTALMAVNADSCNKSKCPVVPKHYDELGCKAIHDNDGCCPKKFECPSIKDDGKCHFKSKTYELNENVPESETYCLAGCFCSDISEQTQLQCAHIECPELFGFSKPECLRVNKPGRCCSEYECDKDKIARYENTKCYYDGKDFRGGEKFYPEDSEYTCICGEGFNNASLINNEDCIPLDCNIPLHYIGRLRDGCVPVYYGKATGCPIDWVCPSEADIKIDEPKLKTDENSPGCTFGKLELALNEKLKSSKSCLTCGCWVPPMIHCVQDSNC